MTIGYESELTRRFFDDFDLMKKKIGIERAKIIKKRLDGLKAAKTFYIYLTTGLGKPHPLYENLKGCYGISITDHVRLIVKPVSDSLDGEALKQCDSLIIKGVMDYHGKKNEWIIP